MLLFDGIDLHHYYTAIALNMDIITPLRFWLQDYCANSFFSVSGQTELDTCWEIYLVTLRILLCVARAAVSFG